MNGDLEGAIACLKQAIALDPKKAVTHYDLGLALHDKHDLDGAITCYRQAIVLNPKYAEAHCNIGHILRRQGHFHEALTYMKRGHELGVKQRNWRYPSAQWVRDAERLVALEGKLPAVLRGEAKPDNPAETVSLASMCLTYKKRYIAAARLYADAFAVEPKLADDLNAVHRYNAACSAALAAAGQGKDARMLPDKVVVMFRRWALNWLRDDLPPTPSSPRGAILRQSR
jgi:eukaryotic-like serine/threonine-protein kinase